MGIKPTPPSSLASRLRRTLNNQGIELRPMLRDDVSSVRALLRSLNGLAIEPWETEELMQEALTLHPELSIVAIASNSNQIVGAAFFGSTGLRAKFQHLGVAAEYQGKGIGHAMVETVIETFRKRSGVRRIVCLVYTSNKAALEFWQKAGFRLYSDLQGTVAMLSRDL